jgi:addiction module HigA family antidote
MIRNTSNVLSRPAPGWNFRGVTTHPGEMLSEEFLKPLGISQNALAMKIRVPATRIGDIIHGRRGITPDTALRLARFFGTSPEFWMNLQQMYDLSKARLELNTKIEKEVEVYSAA